MKRGLLSIGLTTVDIVARPIDRLPEGEAGVLIEAIEIVPAGTAGGTALVAARLGVETSLASAIGDDRIGRFARMVFEEEGVNTRLLATDLQRPTSATVLPIDSQGRRPTLHALGASNYATLSDEIFAAAANAKFVHWAGVGGVNLKGPASVALVREAHDAGAVVTCDLIGPRRSAFEELKRLLPNVAYFMPSATEALYLAEVDSLEAAADIYLGLGATTCIIKNGGAGSLIASGGDRVTVPAHDIVPVDTTSCGDSYCAGFIAALDHGWNLLDAARFATTSAALVALGLGTLGKLKSFEATKYAMSQIPLRSPA